jgi:hypothetical protein
MVQARERGRPIKGEKQPDVLKRIPDKKSYISPRLLEYGNISKLTQSGSPGGFDGVPSMMACL